MIEINDDWNPRLPISLRSKGAVRISPQHPDVVEVACVFEQYPMGMRQSHWLPLNQVIAVPLGHVIYRGSMDIARPPLKRDKVQGFVARKSVNGVYSTHALAGLMPNDNGIVSQTFRLEPFWIDDAKMPPVAISHTEYTRFCVGAFGSFTQHLLGLDTDPDEIFSQYCDLERTYLEGNVFHIAPRREYSDNSTMFQVAVLKTEPDYLNALRSFGRALRLRILDGGYTLPDVEFFAARLNLTIGTEQGFLGPSLNVGVNGYPDARIASRILADRRTLKFKRIVAEVPEVFVNAPPPCEPESQPDEPSDKKKPRPRALGRNSKILPNERPGRRTPRYVFSTGSLLSSFPALSNIPLEKRAERSIPRSNRPCSNPEPLKELEGLSPLPGVGNSPIGRLQHNKSAPSGNLRKPHEPHEPRELQTHFCNENVPLPQRVTVDFNSLDRKLAVFAEVATILDQWDVVDLALSSGVRSQLPIVHAFEWTQEHGRWCWSVKHGRGRRVLVHTLTLHDATVLVAEIERLKRHDVYSIGLIWRYKPIQSIDDVAQIIGQLGIRNSTVHDPGTWPPHVFEDIRFTTLYHSSARTTPNILATDIVETAIQMLGPQIGI